MHQTLGGGTICHKGLIDLLVCRAYCGPQQKPWSQFRATALACNELPCYKYWPGRESNDTDPTDDAFSDTVVVVQHPR